MTAASIAVRLGPIVIASPPAPSVEARLHQRDTCEVSNDNPGDVPPTQSEGVRATKAAQTKAWSYAT